MATKVCSRLHSANAASATTPPDPASRLFTSTASRVAPKPARKDGAPTATSSPVVPSRGRRSDRPIRYGRFRWTKKNQTLIAADTSWPPTVPNAAPRTPSPAPKINSGSSTIWVSTGTTHNIVEKRIRPSALTRLEKPVATIAPAMMITA